MVWCFDCFEKSFKEEGMSDKDRQKKDGQNKDKKNKRMRESVDARNQENVSPRAKAKHKAKMTDTVPRGEAKRRLKP